METIHYIEGRDVFGNSGGIITMQNTFENTTQVDHLELLTSVNFPTLDIQQKVTNTTDTFNVWNISKVKTFSIKGNGNTDISGITTVNTINEHTLNNGVIIDGVLLKDNSITASQLTSTVPIGTSPFVVTSSTKCANLNTDLFDDQDGTYYRNATNINDGTLGDLYLSSNVALLNRDPQTFDGIININKNLASTAYNNGSLVVTGGVGISDKLFVNNVITGTQLSANIANGSAPLIISSSSKVVNLNSDLLDNQEGSYYQNASNINAGTLGDLYLSSNVALLNRDPQTFSGIMNLTKDSASTSKTTGSLVVSGGIGCGNIYSGAISSDRTITQLNSNVAFSKYVFYKTTTDCKVITVNLQKSLDGHTSEHMPICAIIRIAVCSTDDGANYSFGEVYVFATYTGTTYANINSSIHVVSTSLFSVTATDSGSSILAVAMTFNSGTSENSRYLIEVDSLNSAVSNIA